MAEITIRLDGEPVAQGRPRATVIGGRARLYDPQNSRDYKNLLKMCAYNELMKQNQGKKLEGPLELKLWIGRSIPGSWSKKKQQRAIKKQVLPTSKPDTDNYIKGALDALNKTVFDDDSAVVLIQATKFYTDHPHITVKVSEVNNEKAE